MSESHHVPSSASLSCITASFGHIRRHAVPSANLGVCHFLRGPYSGRLSTGPGCQPGSVSDGILGVGQILCTEGAVQKPRRDSDPSKSQELSTPQRRGFQLRPAPPSVSGTLGGVSPCVGPADFCGAGGYLPAPSKLLNTRTSIWASSLHTTLVSR